MIFTKPIIGDRFFTRKEELNFLQKRTDDLKKGYRHNIAIFGKRLSGKSSLIINFLSGLDTQGTTAVYADLSLLTFSAFVDQFIGMLIFDNKTTNPEAGIQDVVETAAISAPKTSKKIKSIYSHIKSAKYDCAYEELLDLPAIYSEETGKFCIIAIDNFETLVNFGLKEPFTILSEKVILQKKSLYILAGYPNASSKKIISEKLSLLFGKFQILDLEPLDLQQSLMFIDQRCQGTNLENNLKQFLAHFSGGEPFYLDIITNSLSVKANEIKIINITDDYFYQILFDSFFTSHSLINQYFSRVIERLCGTDNIKSSIKILNAVIRHGKINSIISDTRCPKILVKKLLEKFTSSDLIVKNGPLHTIEDEVFKMWLKLKEIESLPRFQIDNSFYASRLINEIKLTAEAFKKEQQKPVDDKILNLISAFDNEKVTVGKKTHILPAFKHVNSEIAQPDSILFSAHGSKMWVFSAFNKVINEDDILGFVSFCKKQKHKVSRRILIVLSDITPEARLLALEEHMWIWPLAKLNSLLNLYKKHKIFIS